MAFSVTSPATSLRVGNFITQHSRSMQTSVTKISSYSNAADNPASKVQASMLKAEYKALDQSSINAQNAGAMAKVAEGAFSTATEILQRMKALNVQGADTTLSTEAQQAAQGEYDALNKALGALGKTTYAGKDVFGTHTIKVGDDANTSVSITIGTAPASVTGDFGSSVASDNIDTAIKSYAKEQGIALGWQTALGYVSDAAAQDAANVSEAYSTVNDPNVALEMANYVRSNIAMQSAQLIGAQMNQSAYSVLNLLNP
jgi:flagellin